MPNRKHPSCKHCTSGLMFKTLKSGTRSKKGDPWRFCRNKNCVAYGVDQSKEEVRPDELDTSPVESEVVRKTRERIQRLLKDSRAEVGLMLAMLNQELGCHAAANRLIEEFELGKLGIKKAETDD